MDTIINTALTAFGTSGAIFHAPFLKAHPGFRVKTVLERSKNQSLNVFRDTIIVRNYSEILEDPTIDLVVINTPNHLHYSMGKAALEAGKHVLMEKPFCGNTQEAKTLVALANEKKVVLAPFHNRRFDNGFLTLQELIKQNKLGTISYLESRFDRYRPELNKKQWKETSHPTSGLLYDLGPHLIDEMLGLFGMPFQVAATLKKERKDSRVEDYFSLKCDYKNKTVVLTAGMMHLKQQPRYSVKGSLGSFVKYGLDPQEALLQQGKSPSEEIWAKESVTNWGKLIHQEQTTSFPTVNGNYYLFFKNLYNCIVLNEPLVISTTDAIKVTHIIESAIESNVSQLPIPLKI